MENKTVQRNPAVEIFKKIAICEGISYLLLLGIAMPLKYVFNIPEAVIIVGWLHGLLFILYIGSLLNVQFRCKWSFKLFLLAGFASILPFGPFIFDRKYLN